MAHLFRLLLLLVICAPGLRPAHGAERVGDASFLSGLQGQTEAVNALEKDILALIETAPLEDRFDLYRACNHLMGAWVQVDLSQALLERSIAAQSPLEEEAARTTLRDQARFALWDLDEARGNLERSISDTNRQRYSGVNEAIRALLADARIAIGRLLADQCVHVQCGAAP